jgi:hypothetical protein
VVDKVTKLREVQPPTVSEEVRTTLIRELERTLAEARAGDISECMIVVQHADTALWSDRSSLLTDLVKWAGRLEIVKLDIIAKYKEQDQ